MNDLWTISWRLVQSRTTLRSVARVLHLLLLHRKGMPYVKFTHRRIVTNIIVSSFSKDTSARLWSKYLITLPGYSSVKLRYMFTLCGHIAGLIIVLISKSVSHNSLPKNLRVSVDSIFKYFLIHFWEILLKFSEFVEIIVWQVIPFENPQTHSISGGPYFDQFLWTGECIKTSYFMPLKGGHKIVFRQDSVAHQYFNHIILWNLRNSLNEPCRK